MIKDIIICYFFKPFIIFEPHPKVKPFKGSVRPKYSHFPWWNHYPVAQLPNDGRNAFGVGRPSHSSLSQSIEESQVIHRRDSSSYTVVTLVGMTDKPISDLVPLARSWNFPPEIVVKSPGFSGARYDKYQRAYVITADSKAVPGVLNFNLIANDKSPIVNPAFVIKDWGKGNAELDINGKQIKRGPSFRYGYRNRMEGSDLIVWIQMKSNKTVNFTVRPVANMK